MQTQTIPDKKCRWRNKNEDNSSHTADTYELMITKETNEWRESEQRIHMTNKNKLKVHECETKLNRMVIGCV